MIRMYSQHFLDMLKATKNEVLVENDKVCRRLFFKIERGVKIEFVDQ